MLKRAARRLLRPFHQVHLQQSIFKEVQKAATIRQTGFPGKLNLPVKYGQGLPERVVEILMARLLYQPARETLDVGHANAMSCHLAMLQTLPHPKRIMGIDIAEPVFDVARYYCDSICGDISRSGFEDERFHCIWCISALEHFGRDNSAYTDDFSLDSDLATRALKEMIRILKPGGQLLVTVPFGQYEDHGWLINYDMEHWQNLLSWARVNCAVHELYFRHTFGAGWSLAVAKDLCHVGYYDQANNGSGALAAAVVTKGR